MYSRCVLAFVKAAESVGVRWYLTHLSGVCNAAVFSHSNGEGRKRTLSSCSSDSVSGGLPPTPRRVSWRQKIFLRVASPMNKPSASMQHPGLVTQFLKQFRKRHNMMHSQYALNNLQVHRKWVQGRGNIRSLWKMTILKLPSLKLHAYMGCKGWKGRGMFPLHPFQINTDKGACESNPPTCSHGQFSWL